MHIRHIPPQPVGWHAEDEQVQQVADDIQGNTQASQEGSGQLAELVAAPDATPPLMTQGQEPPMAVARTRALATPA